MGVAPLPDNENERWCALAGYGLLDTPQDPAYDVLARVAADVCETPVAIVSLVDRERQWFKASVGLAGLSETPRDISFCAHALASSEMLEVGDATLDPRFAENPLVTGEPFVRYYAGVPLIDRDGFALGTLCVLDHRPRSLTEKQRSTLVALARSVVTLIEARKGFTGVQLEQVRLTSRAIEHAAEPMAILDIGAKGGQYAVVFVNRAFTEVFGYAEHDIIGLPPEVLHGPKTDLTAVARLRAKTLAGELAFETIYLYSKSRRPLLTEVNDRVMDGTHRVVTCKDRTQAYAIQQALAETNQRLHSLFANNTDAILRIDAAGRCTDANDRATVVFGRSREALLGTGFAECAVDGIFPCGAPFPEPLPSGHPLTFTTTYRRRDGGSMTVEGKAIPILVESATEGAYVMLKDVTESTRSAAIIRQQGERTRALCQIAAMKGSDAEQIDAVLEVARAALDLEMGFVAEVAGDALIVRNTSGEASIAVGRSVPLALTYTGRMIELNAALSIDDITTPESAIPGAANDAWHGYIAAPLKRDGSVYGAVGFVTRRVVPFDEFDRDFVSLVAALISVILERQAQAKRLDRLAFYDAMTQLPNRAHFLQSLDAEISRARRHRRSFAVHFIDLDGFKTVNDRGGHACGDLVLQEVGTRLFGALRQEDSPARLGGDEFVILQMDVGESPVEAFAERIIAILSEPYRVSGQTYALSASVGIAVFPDDGRDRQTLLRRADTALYKAKADGKGRAERCEREPRLALAGTSLQRLRAF